MAMPTYPNQPMPQEVTPVAAPGAVPAAPQAPTAPAQPQIPPELMQVLTLTAQQAGLDVSNPNWVATPEGQQVLMLVMQQMQGAGPIPNPAGSADALGAMNAPNVADILGGSFT